MNISAERGGSTLAAVMMLLVMGLMLLNAQHRQLDSALLLATDEKRYLRAYNQAASALSWGVAQSWSHGQLNESGWWCRQTTELRACAKLSSQAGIVLVRGEAPMMAQSLCGYINGANLRAQPERLRSEQKPAGG